MNGKAATVSHAAGSGSRQKTLVYWAVVVLGALPALWLVWAFVTDNLGANPVETINNLTGRAAILLLMASLLFSPVNTMLDLHAEYRIRRALGLWAFAYAALHFLNFVGLNYGFNLQFMLADGVPMMPYIVVGFVALAMLALLAATSNKWSVRRLGFQGWRRLHTTVYIVAVLVILHFFWQAKVAERWEPLLYALAMGILLIVRIPTLRQRWPHLRASH